VPPFDKFRANALCVVITLLSLFVFFTPSQANPAFPPLSARVVDAANILPPDREAAIMAKLERFETSTRQQLVVATIPSLEGYDIADYGYRLGRAWGIGTKERKDGVLLIIAPNDRKLRIEVGYGLEPVLTDAMSSVIINRVIVPRFKSGDMPAGIEAGVDAIVQQIELPPEQARARAAEAAQTQAQRKGDDGFPASILFWAFIFFFVILPLLRGFGGRRRRHSSGVGDIILWSALNAASNIGNNDSGWGGGGWGDGGGFSGGGGSFGGGGASGDW
jgi:uncharacterized protein